MIEMFHQLMLVILNRSRHYNHKSSSSRLKSKLSPEIITPMTSVCYLVHSLGDVPRPDSTDKIKTTIKSTRSESLVVSLMKPFPVLHNRHPTPYQVMKLIPMLTLAVLEIISPFFAIPIVPQRLLHSMMVTKPSPMCPLFRVLLFMMIQIPVLYGSMPSSGPLYHACVKVCVRSPRRPILTFDISIER